MPMVAAKPREETQRNKSTVTWWDLLPLLEQTKRFVQSRNAFTMFTLSRPVAWTKSHVLFTAHDQLPAIVGSVHPSTRSFILPSPPAILEAAERGRQIYAPPTLLCSTAPARDEFECLFAYFPVKPSCVKEVSSAASGGLGCFYFNPSCAIDEWVVGFVTHFPRGAGAVACRWVGEERTVSALFIYVSNLRGSGQLYHLAP